MSRAHYRLVWAALSFMNRVPVWDGRPCVFRVVRVSGTVRKVEEEAIRRAKLLILAARDEIAGRTSSNALGTLLRSDRSQPRSVAALAGAAGDDSESEPVEGESSDDGR